MDKKKLLPLSAFGLFIISNCFITSLFLRGMYNPDATAIFHLCKSEENSSEMIWFKVELPYPKMYKLNVDDSTLERLSGKTCIHQSKVTSSAIVRAKGGLKDKFGRIQDYVLVGNGEVIVFIAEDSRQGAVENNSLYVYNIPYERVDLHLTRDGLYRAESINLGFFGIKQGWLELLAFGLMIAIVPYTILLIRNKRRIVSFIVVILIITVICHGISYFGYIGVSSEYSYNKNSR